MLLSVRSCLNSFQHFGDLCSGFWTRTCPVFEDNLMIGMLILLVYFALRWPHRLYRHLHLFLRGLFCLISQWHRSERLICVLRDGRKLIGYLRSVDQFGLFTMPRSSFLWQWLMHGELKFRSTSFYNLHSMLSILSLFILFDAGLETSMPSLHQQIWCCKTRWSESMWEMHMQISNAASTLFAEKISCF